MRARKSNPELVKLVRWLESNPSLEELQKRHPTEWTEADRDLQAALRNRNKTQLDDLLKPVLPKHAGFAALPDSKLQEIRRALVKQRMTALAIERGLKASFTEEKSIHIGFLDRFWFYCLFFDRHYRRRLVSNVLYGLLWPLVRRKKYLPHLAEAHGIYCFYSRRLIADLTALMIGRDCIEIAAGDGALTRCLRHRGIDIAAFDDRSWAGKVSYSRDVSVLDAGEALREHEPEVVICSWPPANNSFERQVFATSSVERYIVIGGDNKLAFGNWPSYLAQREFTMRRDDRLSAGILPRGSGGAVYVFDRK